jgi:hypothetical protein
MGLRKNKKIIAFSAGLWILGAAFVLEEGRVNQVRQASGMIVVYKASSQ